MMHRFLLGLSLVLLAAISPAGAQEGDKTPAKNVAHIRIGGNLDENPVSADPLLGSSSENFKSKMDRIAKAAKDKSVHALIIQIEGTPMNWAKIEELRGAIDAFRKTGKKTYAYLDSADTREYLSASACDLVCVPEAGWLMIVGLRAEVSFYKDLLEKLGIKADFLQMGVYKFAAEPYTRSKMSPEAKAQLKLVLDDFYDKCLVGGISSSRSKAHKELSPDKVAKLIDEGPFTARRAKELGLIDEMLYFDDLEKLIKKDLDSNIKVVKDYGMNKMSDVDFSNPFAIFKLLMSQKPATKGTKDRIALIYATGPIMTGKSSESLFGGHTMGSTTIIEAIRQAENDPKVKAIVLRVDSPGGSALASDLIWNELKRSKKPVIASMSDVAASGGYYISMAAKKIYAQPGTLTGSIGVVGGKLALAGLYDKVGITTETISRGSNAGILSSTDVFSASERKAMEKLMIDVYDQFLSKAIAGRAEAGKKFTKEQLLKYAEGRIWTGRQAKEIGLIDALGGLDDAIADAKVMAGLAKDADVDYLVLPKARTFLDSLLEKSGDAQVVERLLRTGGVDASQLEGLLNLREDPVWMMMPHSVRVR